MAGLTIGVEVGGTFTDWVAAEGGRVVRSGKVLSSPKNPETAVLAALNQAVAQLSDIAVLAHGSTVATNVVVEKKGALVALLTTEGFRDVLLIQRQSKNRLFDLFYRQPEPLVTRDRILEVIEKTAPSGVRRRALQTNGVIERLGRLIAETGVESVAISFIHAYANANHEEAVADLVKQTFPDIYVTCSSEVLPQFREYERTSTTVLTAYTKPIVDKYISGLEEQLQQADFHGQFLVMQANGGMIPAFKVREHAARMILSGPAAGVLGAIHVSGAAGLSNILTFDMGGTSTDVCLVTDGLPQITTEYKISGLPLQLPMLDIVTVGAGGGSIAAADKGGILGVGPQSAGADPGPACYGRGGTAFTVTDANLLLGRIRPHRFFGAKMILDVDAAQGGLDQLAGSIGLSNMDTAEGVIRLANVTMAQAMRLVSVERGFDPRDYAIVAYGGCGPLHAALLAEELSVGQVLVPRDPGILSAHGLLIVDTKQDFVLTRITPVDRLKLEDLKNVFADLDQKAIDELKGYGFQESDIRLGHALDLRYIGQAYELTLDADDFYMGNIPIDGLSDRFRALHRRNYGHATGEPVEVVNYRVSAVVPTAIQEMYWPQEASKEPIFETGRLYLNGTWVDANFYDRMSLPVHYQIEGPAVVEEDTATTYIPPGWVGKVDTGANLLLTRGAS